MVLTCKSAKDFLLGNPPKGLIKPMLLWTFTFYFLWYYLREIRKEEILFWVDSFIRKKERKRVIDILPAPKLPWFGHNCWFLQIFLRQDKSLYFWQCLRNYVGICILPGCIIHSFPENLAGKNYSRLPFVWNPSMLRIRNDLFQIRIQLRIFWVPDPTHIIEAYSEIIFKNLKFNQKEKSTNYLPFSISYCSPIVQYIQCRIHRPKMRNNIFIYLFFHFLLDTDPEQ